MKSVAVFGAGIAGLAAAHEFAGLGYRVAVYEANTGAGGFCRSARVAGGLVRKTESEQPEKPWWDALSGRDARRTAWNGVERVVACCASCICICGGVRPGRWLDD